MAVYTITHKQVVNNYAVVQTLTNAEIQTGETITIGAVDATFNGSHIVYACPAYYFLGVDDQGDFMYDVEFPVPNQFLFPLTTPNIERGPATGTLTHTQVCTWISATQIEDWIGIGTATTADQQFLTQCAAAANAFCFRRRQEAGWQDLLSTSPSADVTLGTVMMGGAYYRQRGSIDQFASFSNDGAVPVTGMSGIIKQLLAIDRPQVA